MERRESRGKFIRFYDWVEIKDWITDFIILKKKE